MRMKRYERLVGIDKGAFSISQEQACHLVLLMVYVRKEC